MMNGTLAAVLAKTEVTLEWNPWIIPALVAIVGAVIIRYALRRILGQLNERQA